jgi:hypothetical protein
MVDPTPRDVAAAVKLATGSIGLTGWEQGGDGGGGGGGRILEEGVGGEREKERERARESERKQGNWTNTEGGVFVF